ncbi:MAG: glycosyltransferase [Proteobacteria bacterium]|nr:glycosyltransferase [Pseudomonadota bacterium]
MIGINLRRLARAALYKIGIAPDLKARVEQLELLLTEYPDVAMGSLSPGAFPSPAVSIILPSWNRAGLVTDAIRSVQAQRFADWELLLIDDGSTDTTAQVVAPFLSDARIRYIPQAHGGQCTARNQGLRLARGALIAYLDSDNLWYPNFLAGAVAAFAADPEMLSAYGALVMEPRLTAGIRILFKPFSRQRLQKSNFIPISVFVHRKSLFDRWGGFDETLKVLEDWDLVLRYTQEAPAHRLPFLAARQRALDTQRVSLLPQGQDFRKVARKWSRA